MELGKTQDEELTAIAVNKLKSLPGYIGHILSAIVLFVLYVILAEWSYYFVIPPSSAAVFWLPSGISAAIFIRFRWHREFWPVWLLALFCGELFVLLDHNVVLITSLIWATVNLLLPLSIVILARKFIKGPFDFRRLRDVVTFMIIVPVAVIPGALIAAIGSVIGFHADYWSSALSWGASDALGIILGAPVILSWTSRATRVNGQFKEAIILFSSLVFLAVSIFLFSHKEMLDPSYYSFLIFFLAWASIRFGAQATSLGLLIIDLVGVWVTKDSGENLFNMQILVANIGFLMLALAAAIEEQRTALQNASETLKMRDDFISVAAHELKTPLSSLMLQTQMINRYIGDGRIHHLSQDQLKNLAGIAEQQVRTFSYLINDLLDVSRIGAGRLSLNLTKVDIVEIIANTITHFKMELDANKCEIKFDDSKKIFGRWDKIRIEQVITNLLSNAIKYGPGKPIEITAEVVRENVVISFRDYGIGIDLEDQHRIFDRFERAVPIKNHIGGLGLGLFITKQIIVAHEGSIRVESAKGEGSKFIVELPLSLN